MNLVRSIFAIGAIAALLGASSLQASSQDSRPKSPPKADAAKDDGEKKDGDDKKESGGKNPLEDPVWQSRAKLGKILAKKRCVICHKIEGKGGVLSPPMEEVVANRFTSMEKYDQYVENLKRTDPARYRASKTQLDAIVAEKDRYKKLVLWLESYLLKPTFDNGKAKMTPQVLKKDELAQVIAFVLTLEPKAEDGEKKESTR